MCGFFGEDEDDEDISSEKLTLRQTDRLTYENLHNEVVRGEYFYKHMLIEVTENVNCTMTDIPTELQQQEVKTDLTSLDPVRFSGILILYF